MLEFGRDTATPPLCLMEHLIGLAPDERNSSNLTKTLFLVCIFFSFCCLLAAEVKLAVVNWMLCVPSEGSTCAILERRCCVTRSSLKGGVCWGGTSGGEGGGGEQDLFDANFLNTESKLQV